MNFQLFLSESNIEAAKVSCYSLEESRICSRNPEEGNFHIFYVIAQQLPENLRRKLYLDELRSFTYLNSCLESNVLTSQSFSSFDMALSSFGYSEESKNLIYAWLAAILHLGEIQFELTENDYVSGVSKSSIISLNYAANLLNIEADQLRNSIILHPMSSKENV